MRLKLSHEKNVVCHEINHFGLLLRDDEPFGLKLLSKQKNHFGYGEGFLN